MGICSIYDVGFTMDIVPNDKGALIGSQYRDWDFLDEFVFNEGPEFSVFLDSHPYTQQMINDTKVKEVQDRIKIKQSRQDDIRRWTVWSVLNPYI